MDEFSKILLPTELLNDKEQLDGIQDVRMFVQMISEKFPEKSIQLLLDHLYSATFERGAKRNLPICFYNFTLLYCWITGRARNVKVKKIQDAINVDSLDGGVFSFLSFKSEE
jgi:hypothetical protein